MEFNYIVDLLGLSQGIILGILLIVVHKSVRPSFLLGLFLLTYTIEIFPNLLVDAGYAYEAPQLIWLPLRFYFLSMPLLYLYARQLSGKLSWRQDWKHLIVGALEVLIIGAMFLLEAGGSELFFDPETIEGLFDGYFLLGLIFSLTYGVKILFFLRTHRHRLLQYHSNTQEKELKWLSLVVIVILVFAFCLVLIESVIDFDIPEEQISFFVSAWNVLIIYFIAIGGIRQSSIRFSAELLAPLTEKNSSSADQDRKEQAIQRLLDFMEQERPYLDQQLTISDLANKLATSERSLSRLINEGYGKHFNGFINDFRVVAAQELLSNTSYDHFTMEGIALEAGFNSKATFYAAFKRKLGQSPAQFKAQSPLLH